MQLDRERMVVVEGWAYSGASSWPDLLQVIAEHYHLKILPSLGTIVPCWDIISRDKLETLPEGQLLYEASQGTLVGFFRYRAIALGALL